VTGKLLIGAAGGWLMAIPIEPAAGRRAAQRT